MAPNLNWLVNPELWFGSSVGVIGYVGGHIKARNGRMAALEREVANCRERDADFRIVSAGVRLMVGELRRELPHSPALKMFGDLMDEKLGPPPSIDEFQELLRQCDEVAPDYQPPEKQQ